MTALVRWDRIECVLGGIEHQYSDNKEVAYSSTCENKKQRRGEKRSRQDGDLAKPMMDRGGLKEALRGLSRRKLSLFCFRCRCP